MEFTGFIWAFGYFLQRGYVSYLFGLPIAVVGIGLIHRIVRKHVDQRDDRWRYAVLGVVQVLAFLAHLVAWGVLAVTTLCYVLALYRDNRRGQATRLLAVAAPPVALLVWYTAAVREAGHLALYTTARDKLLSLAETLQFFPRLDPYSGSVASFPVQLLLIILLIGIVGANVGHRSARRALRTPLPAPR